MSYTDKQVALKIANIIKGLNANENVSSFSNGVISYNNESYELPTTSSLKRKTYLNNR